MSDTHDDDAATANELLLEDALAGDPDALAAVIADDQLVARFEDLVTMRDAIREPAPAVPVDIRGAHLAAALDAFDAQAPSTADVATGGTVVSMARGRRRGRWAGAAAAAALAVAGVGGALSLGGGDGALVADSADDAAEAADFTVESDAAAESAAADEAAVESIEERAQASTGVAPEAADAAQAATESAVVAADEAVMAEADMATADALPLEAIVPDGPLDPRFEECVEQFDLPDRPWSQGVLLDEVDLGEDERLVVVAVMDDFEAVWIVEFTHPSCELRLATPTDG